MFSRMASELVASRDVTGSRGRLLCWSCRFRRFRRTIVALDRKGYDFRKLGEYPVGGYRLGLHAGWSLEKLRDLPGGFNVEIGEQPGREFHTLAEPGY